MLPVMILLDGLISNYNPHSIGASLLCGRPASFLFMPICPIGQDVLDYFLDLSYTRNCRSSIK